MGNKAIVASEDGRGSWARPRGESWCVAANAKGFCKARGLAFTPIMEASSLEDLMETLEASASVAVALFSAGLEGDPTVDPEVARQAGEVLRRIRRQTMVLERSLLRKTWAPKEGADEWVDQWSGAAHHEVEHRVIKHWKQHASKGKAAATPAVPRPLPVVSHLIDIESWAGLDVFRVDRESGNPLTQVFMAIWSSRSFEGLLKCRSVPAFEFMKAIEGKYRDNPYHNRMHAADVCMAAYFLYSQVERQPAMDGYFSALDLLALVLAAAVHDVAHPGLTNDFMVKTRDSLALRYNDKSVLENMHVATAFELMRDQGVDLLEHNEPAPPQQLLRSRIIEMVLATDMAVHKSVIENFASALDNCDEQVQDLDKLVFERLLLHVADIGHPLRPREIHREWSKRVTEEFFSIGDREKELGLSPMALFDREKAPPLAKGQVGFLTFVVRPSWNALARALGSATEQPGACFDANLKMWEDEESEPAVELASLKSRDAKPADRLSTGSKGELFCDACSHHIEGPVAKANGRNYHVGCFKCEMCRAPLSGAFVIFEDKNFCTTCGDRKEREANPECCKCRKPIEGLYKKLPDGTKICTQCSPQDSCDACREPISGKYLEFHGKRFHKECFTCEVCKGSLDEGVFTNKAGTDRLCKVCMAKRRAEEQQQQSQRLQHTASSVSRLSTDQVACSRCAKKLEGDIVITKCEERFHKECFLCDGCSKCIDGEYSIEDAGKYSLKVFNRARKKYFCKKCSDG